MNPGKQIQCMIVADVERELSSDRHRKKKKEKIKTLINHSQGKNKCIDEFIIF